MSRLPAIDDRRDVRDIEPIDCPHPADVADLGPADGCDGSPWCRCWDCARVPAGGFFTFEADEDDGECW